MGSQLHDTSPIRNLPFGEVKREGPRQLGYSTEPHSRSRASSAWKGRRSSSAAQAKSPRPTRVIAYMHICTTHAHTTATHRHTHEHTRTPTPARIAAAELTDLWYSLTFNLSRHRAELRPISKTLTRPPVVLRVYLTRNDCLP